MVSIIIPVFNQHEMTRECIEAIRDNTTDYEIIVIDNGSDPEFIPETPATVIRNIENKGFPVAVNEGIRESMGDIIILLNNDIIVPPGWAESLAAWLSAFSIIGPMTNYCAGRQWASLPLYDNMEEFVKRASAFSEEHHGEAEEVNFVIGFCMAFKKSLYGEIGPFDESLWPCSGEEIDFCFRAREAGHKIGIARDVYVHHFGSVTFNEMQKAGLVDYSEIVNRNDAHLAERWGADFWHRQGIERGKR